ncbi:Nn.00g075160.m01.CDS01 [Neocucurbitaria sp. VM-36]
MVFILFKWLMPKNRKPLWLEVTFNNYLKSITEHLSQQVRDTPLEYWLLHPEGQVGTLFMTVILVAISWMIMLEYSSRAAHRVASPTATHAKHAKVQDPKHIQKHSRPKTPPVDYDNFSPGATPFMRRLAPPGHRPTNAHLVVSPYHIARPLGTPNRSNRVTNLGFQTPSSRPTRSRNFSGLAEAAPVSYDTLQETGMLSSDGTPTKKWSLLKRMIEAGDRMGKGKGKKVVAYWENEIGRKGGRAILRQELDKEDGFF